jgi:hypothetical protein
VAACLLLALKICEGESPQMSCPHAPPDLNSLAEIGPYLKQIENTLYDDAVQAPTSY